MISIIIFLHRANTTENSVHLENDKNLLCCHVNHIMSHLLCFDYTTRYANMWGSFISDAQQHCSYATDWPQSLLRCWSKKYQLSDWQAGGCLERTTWKFQVNLIVLLSLWLLQPATWPTTNCFTVKDSSSSPHTAVQGDAVALPWPAIKCCLQLPPLLFYMPRLWQTQIMSKVIKTRLDTLHDNRCASVLFCFLSLWFPYILDGILKINNGYSIQINLGLTWGRPTICSNDVVLKFAHFFPWFLTE